MERIIWLPVFTRFNVLGREFPSEDSIVMILSELKSSENMYNFCVNNDMAHETLDGKFNPEKYLSRRSELYTEIIPILELRLKRLPIYQKMCEMVDSIFPILWQSMCVVMWFNFMVGNYRGDGKQKRSMELAKFRRIVNSEISNSNFRISKMEHDPILDKYPEYREAIEYFWRFDDKATALAEVDREMEQLFRDLLDIEVKMSSISKIIKKGYRPFLCPNPKCRKPIMLSPTDSRKHCGECERYYNTNSKRKNNLKKGWIEDPNQTGLCVGTCGSVRRKLNSDRTCKQCYPKKF